MQNKQIKKNLNVRLRKKRVRSKISGTAAKPRLNVFRSLKHTYAQLIDDQKGVTIAYAKDTEIKDKATTKVEQCQKIGELLAKRAKEAGVEQAVFDKSSYKYHGRVQAVAEGARKGGLKF
jgi:large subunit ribosomal protein L18